MNKIFLLGRLTRDPEIRVTPSTNRSVCTFTLAVDRPFASQNGERETDFINIVVWGKSAELCSDYVTKGQRLLVEGRLQLRNYVDKDGNKRYVTEVVADRVEFIERKGSGAYSEGRENAASADGGAMGGFGKPVGNDDDIPF